MLLRLISPQFLFESGTLFVWAGARSADATSVPSVPLDHNVVDLPSTTAGRIVIVGHEIVVQSRLTPALRRVAALVVETELTSLDLSRGNADILVDFRAFARLVAARTPSGEHTTIGVSLEGATLELTPNDEGYVDVLLPLGKNLIYLLSEPPVRRWMTIESESEDAGVLNLSE